MLFFLFNVQQSRGNPPADFLYIKGGGTNPSPAGCTVHCSKQITKKITHRNLVLFQLHSTTVNTLQCFAAVFFCTYCMYEVLYMHNSETRKIGSYTVLKLSRKFFKSTLFEKSFLPSGSVKKFRYLSPTCLG